MPVKPHVRPETVADKEVAHQAIECNSYAPRAECHKPGIRGSRSSSLASSEQSILLLSIGMTCDPRRRTCYVYARDRNVNSRKSMLSTFTRKPRLVTLDGTILHFSSSSNSSNSASKRCWTRRRLCKPGAPQPPRSRRAF